MYWNLALLVMLKNLKKSKFPLKECVNQIIPQMEYYQPVTKNYIEFVDSPYDISNEEKVAEQYI